MTLIVAQLFHVFECKSETHSLFGVPFFNNKKLIGAVMVSGRDRLPGVGKHLDAGHLPDDPSGP